MTIGSTQPLSGLAVPGYSEISQGAQAYFHYLNANGGVHDRSIRYLPVDDAYDPARTVTQTRTLVEKEGVFAMFNALGTSTHERVVDYLNNHGVPDVFVGSGCPCWADPAAHPMTFGWQPDYTIEGKILGNYVAHTFAKKKVGYFFQGDDFGRTGVAGLDRVLPRRQVVARESYQPQQSNIAAQVRKLQARHADVVVSFSLPTFTALLELNMIRLRYHPTLVVASDGADPRTLATLFELLGKKAGSTVDGAVLTRGIVTDTFLPSLADTHNSWVALFRQIHDKYIPQLPFDGNVEYGMAAAYTFAQALQAAGANPTREGFRRAIEAGLGQGPALLPFAYSTSSHAGVIGAQVAVSRGLTLHLLGRPMTTNDGAAPVRPFTGAQPIAPAAGIPSPR